MLHRIQIFLFNISDLAVGLCRLQELKLPGLSRRGPGFDPRPVSVGFMPDKVALGQVFLKTNQLMTYKTKAAVCSDIRTKHSTQNEYHVEFFNVKPGGT
jgi:hypothetical protein